MTRFSFILLGSNMGDREVVLDNAIKEIEKRCGRIVNKSSLYESEPWGFDTDLYFLNQAIAVETELEPHDLLKELLTIEAELGRRRNENHIGYESRPIDLDIIYIDDMINDDDDLILPHPRMHLRRFVLVPLSEISPDFVHPILRESNSTLLDRCEDQSEVRLY
ncbi:MAG: 2-amino-4-hydroxy-6-hydroxymethyldihydropteridine diphosphokinase [Bacteroidales bacterium]|jgi:2-amino-4-hydroxy-6-hydroxymethyldihydropteridine diphosphokinase|nr:2-amino-4-hydroxy-6-hydroxymethyldihydropteridine diphosphokinase [Bacteroidales bacterium]